jgi:hypothetical protein
VKSLLRRLDDRLADQLIRTVLHGDAEYRAGGETLYVRIAIMAVKIRRTRCKNRSRNGHEQATGSNAHGVNGRFRLTLQQSSMLLN